MTGPTDLNVKYEAKRETSCNIFEYALHWNTLKVHKPQNLFINKVEKDACLGAYPNPLYLPLEFGLIHTVNTCTQTVSSSMLNLNPSWGDQVADSQEQT